jgi:hypothetical protein
MALPLILFRHDRGGREGDVPDQPEGSGDGWVTWGRAVTAAEAAQWMDPLAQPRDAQNNAPHNHLHPTTQHVAWGGVGSAGVRRVPAGGWARQGVVHNATHHLYDPSGGCSTGGSHTMKRWTPVHFIDFTHLKSESSFSGIFK